MIFFAVRHGTWLNKWGPGDEERFRNVLLPINSTLKTKTPANITTIKAFVDLAVSQQKSGRISYAHSIINKLVLRKLLNGNYDLDDPEYPGNRNLVYGTTEGTQIWRDLMAYVFNVW